MTSPHLTLIAAAMLTLCVSKSIAGEAVVIGSTTDKFKAGQIIESSEEVHLKKDVQVRLLLENGSVLRLEGPYQGAISEERLPNGQSVIRSIARLFDSEAQGNSVMAAMRRAPVEPSGPWAIDVTLPGHHCVRQGMKTLMWRPKITVSDKLELIDAGGEKSTQNWPMGKATLDWPISMPLKNGQTFTANLFRAKTSTILTMHVVPDEFATEPHRVAWMADVRCDSQARLLLDQID
jgi:hypothetical protein